MSLPKFLVFTTIHPGSFQMNEVKLNEFEGRQNDVSKYRCCWVIQGKYNHLSRGAKIAEQQFDFVAGARWSDISNFNFLRLKGTKNRAVYWRGQER